MNIAMRRPMTLEQFLAWEDRQELRYESDGFQPVAMTGGTAAHSGIQRNIIFSVPLLELYADIDLTAEAEAEPPPL